MESKFNSWSEQLEKLNATNQDLFEEGRHIIEVGFRSEMPEIIDSFSKLVLGYVGAAMKNLGYHIKYVFTEKPHRVLVSTRNWDDGEWIGVVSYHEKLNCFILSKGFYNKDRRTVSVQHNKKCAGNSASQISSELRDELYKLEKENPKPRLKSIKLKRGPKK